MAQKCGMYPLEREGAFEWPLSLECPLSFSISLLVEVCLSEVVGQCQGGLVQWQRICTENKERRMDDGREGGMEGWRDRGIEGGRGRERFTCCITIKKIFATLFHVCGWDKENANKMHHFQHLYKHAYIPNPCARKNFQSEYCLTKMTSSSVLIHESHLNMDMIGGQASEAWYHDGVVFYEGTLPVHLLWRWSSLGWCWMWWVQHLLWLELSTMVQEKDLSSNQWWHWDEPVYWPKWKWRKC